MRHIILHGHIFKNAGTTFDWSLARNFGDAFLDHRDDRAMRQQRDAHLAAVVQGDPGLRALSSHHLCYTLPALTDVQFYPAYLLRHPIERVASVYAFERRQQSDSLGARAAKEKNFQEYVAWRMGEDVPRTIRDYQTAYLCGSHGRGVRGTAPVDWLERALEHLAGLDCVGVVDRYDESMVVFEDRLAAAFPGIDLAYVRQNATRGRGEEQALEERVRDTLQRLGGLAATVLAQNSFDLVLYRQANQQLDAALATLEDPEARLEDFRRRCAALR